MRSKNKSKNELVKAIIDTYQPETAKDVQDALKDILALCSKLCYKEK